MCAGRQEHEAQCCSAELHTNHALRSPATTPNYMDQHTMGKLVTRVGAGLQRLAASMHKPCMLHTLSTLPPHCVASHHTQTLTAGDESIARLDKLRNAKGSLRTAEIRRKMQRVMQNNAAVFRTQESLAEGCKLIDECVDSFADVKVRQRGGHSGCCVGSESGWVARGWVWERSLVV